MDPNDSYMKIESLDSRLDELTRRRKLLEQRSEMRRRTMEEFEILRKQSQQRLAKSLEQQNEEARKRNSTLISKYNESSRISQEQIRMKKLLQKEKEKYLKHVETMQPLWHRCQAIKLEEKIMQLKDEKLQSIKRKEKLKMELLREEKMRFGLEQQRRELLIQLAVEQKELMEIKANSIYHTEEGKHIENIILSKMERVNEELKMLISNNLERVKSLNLDVPYPEEQVYFREYSDMEVYNINKEMSRIIEENKNSNNNSDNDRQRRALNDERLRRLSDQINQFTQNDSSMNNNTTYGGSNSYNNSAGGGGRMDDRYLAINNDRVVKNSQNYTKIDRNSQPGSESEAVEISVPLKKNLTRSNSVRFEEPVSSRVDKVNSNISEAVITEKVIRPEEFAIQKSTEPLERTDSFSLKSDSEESLAVQLNKKQDSPRKTTDNARDQTLINRIISRTASDYSIDEFDGANSNNNANGNTTNQVYHPNVPLDESNTSITGLSKIGSNKLATRSIDDDFIFNPAPIGGINAVSPSKSQDSIINSMPDSSVKETESPAKSVDEFEVVEERPLVSSSEELNQYVRNMKNSECVRLLKTVCGPLESKLMGGTIAADEVYKAVPTENGKSITVPHARRVYDYLVSLNGQENNAEIIDSIDIGMMGNIVMSIAIHKSTELIPIDAFTGVVTVDKLKKEYKKRATISPHSLELWECLIKHFQKIVEKQYKYFSFLSSCFTDVLINHVPEEDKDRLHRKVSNLLQIAMLPEEGGSKPSSPEKQSLTPAIITGPTTANINNTVTTNKYAAYQSQDEKAEPITAPTASSSAQNNIPDDDEFGYSNSSFGRQGNSDDSLDNQSKPSPPKTQFSYASILGNTSKPTELDDDEIMDDEEF